MLSHERDPALADASLLGLLAKLPDAVLADIRAAWGEAQWTQLAHSWPALARGSQRAPKGEWRQWLLMAGRGFGKTRCGAEWINAMARGPLAVRIALVGATFDDVRHVMIEGESGILACAGDKHRPLWHPSLKRLMWSNGSMATCYSAAEAEGLRGPQHHVAWIDEVGRWDVESGPADARSGRTRGQAALDNLLMGLRLGDAPQLVATTTPRAGPLMRQLLALDATVVTRGTTFDNAANLPAAFMATMRATYGDTLIGRQELLGELIEEVPGALWTRRGIEACRVVGAVERLSLSRVVIGVDPPASSTGDACGIVVAAARDCAGGAEMVVLEDASVERVTPDAWASAVADAAARWGADCIVAEANNGGEMVRRVIEAEAPMLPVRLVHARHAKGVRAEPVAHAYARGRVGHAGAFARLEDEMCGLIVGGGYAGPGRSPDRADAMVWALSDLMRGAGRRGPVVMGL